MRWRLKDEINFNFLSSSCPRLSNRPYIIKHCADLLTLSPIELPPKTSLALKICSFRSQLALLLTDTARQPHAVDGGSLLRLRLSRIAVRGQICSTKGNRSDSPIRQRWTRRFARMDLRLMRFRISSLREGSALLRRAIGDCCKILNSRQ